MGHLQKAHIKLFEESRIPGVVRFARMRLIPIGVSKLEDARRKENKNIETFSYKLSLMDRR